MSAPTDGPIQLATPGTGSAASDDTTSVAGGLPPRSTGSETPLSASAAHAVTAAAVADSNAAAPKPTAIPIPTPADIAIMADAGANSAPAFTGNAAAAAPAPAAPTSPVTRTRSRANTLMNGMGANAEAGPSRTSPRSTTHRAANGVQSPTTAKAQAQLPKPREPFLQPHHFSSLNNGARPSTALRSEWKPVYPGEEDLLSPEDDPMALRGIPVFHPTMEEFKDFEAYVTRTAPWGMRSGIVKVVPPAEWTDTLPPMNRRTLSQVQIKRPIQQNMMGSAGMFRATNIEKNKTRALSVREWFDKCQDDAFAPPNIKTYERDSKELKAAHEEARKERAEREKRKKEEARARREKSKLERLKREEAATKREGSQALDAAGSAGTDGMKHEVPELDPPSSGSSRSSEPAKTPELEPLDSWYEEVDLKSAWLPRNTTEEDYTDEACLKLQEKYWKTMGLGEPSWYGADLMQDKATPWNVANLPNLLDRVKCVVPGVNEPYLYFGMWRASFAWHVEDMDLFSINYIHFGAPKFWYAIPQGQAEQLERFLANEFPIDSKACDQFIRHKSMAISPSRLRSAGIRCNMLVHRQGEFVITYPKGYHAGFNMGFNCAESVNFALDSWIDYGRKAKHCQCVRDSVHIDVDKMLRDAEDAVAQPRGVKAAKRAKYKDEHEEGEAEEQEGQEKVGRKAPKEKQGEQGEDDTPRKRRKTKKGKVEIAGEEGEQVVLQPIPAYMPAQHKRTTIELAPLQPQHFAPLQFTSPLTSPFVPAQSSAAPSPAPAVYPNALLSNLGDPASTPALAPAAGSQPPSAEVQDGPPQMIVHPPQNPFTLDSAPTRKPGRPRKSVPLVSVPAPVYPCLFCPSLSEADRAYVHEPNAFVKAQWRGGADKPVMAHIRCAQATPEIAIDDVEKDGKVETWIMGVNDIVKARWKLKCKTCDPSNDSTGIKVQCTKGKCVQAFHFTCAEQDERVTCNLWQVEQLFKEDETMEDSPMVTDISLKLELLCPSHNPAQKAIREKEKLEDIRCQLLAIIPGQTIKLKMGPASTVCKMVRVLEQEQMVEVDVAGVTETVPWSKVDIKPAPPPKVVENEYARHHTHKRDGEPPTPVTANSATIPVKRAKTSKEPKAKAGKEGTIKRDRNSVGTATPTQQPMLAAQPRASLPNLPRAPLPPIATAEMFQEQQQEPNFGSASGVAAKVVHPPPSHPASAGNTVLPPLGHSVPMHHRTTPDMPAPLGRPPVDMPPPPLSAGHYGSYPPQNSYPRPSSAYDYPPYNAPHLPPHMTQQHHQHQMMHAQPRTAPAGTASHQHHQDSQHQQLPGAASLPGYYAPPVPLHRQVLHPSYTSQPPIQNRVYVVDSHTPSPAPAYGYYDRQHPQHHYHLPPPQLPPLQRSQYPAHPSGYAYPAPPPGPPAQAYLYGQPSPHGLPAPPTQHPSYAYPHGQPAQHGFTSMPPMPANSDVRRHSGGPSSYPPPSPVPSQGHGPPGSASSSSFPPPNSAPLPSPAHFAPAPASAPRPQTQTPGIDLGLDRMRRIMAKLELIRTPAIHLAGTNGKGSVSAMLESAFMAAGMSVGRYNSPHLLEPRDAVRINGEPVAADTYAEAVQHIERVGASMGLTKFESATAAALDLINRAGVDVMIIECGMGGARDATNILPPNLVLATGLTAVGLDHTAVLGNTVEEITSDKAQIAVADAIMVVGVQPFRSVYDTASQVCQSKGSKLIYTLSARVSSPASGFAIKPFKAPTPATICVQVQDADGKFQDLPTRLPLAGAHQVDNLALVVTMLDALRKDPRACAILGKLQRMADETIQKGIAATKWEGRCSWIEHPHFGPLLLDGAHNADSATTLRRYIDSLHLPSKTNLTFVLGLSDSKGKSPDSVLAPLFHTGDGVAVVGFSPVEGMPWVSPVAKELVERAATGLKAVKLYSNKGQTSEYARQGKLDGSNQSQMDELAAALEWAKKRKGLTVVCGSLYLVADAYRLLKQ